VKFLLRTHGCRANQYDSEAVRMMMFAGGAIEVEDAEVADVAIFNSCSVTAAAEADLRQDVRRAARANPYLRTIVMGCAPGLAARNEQESPLRTLPLVSDAIVGADLGLLASVLGLPASAVGAPRGAQTGARGLLRIQDGCDEHCTFCATTLARGENRSRSQRELIAEAEELSTIHPEIVLTGIHIGSYGKDIGSSLSLLVSDLIAAIPSVRFRLSSLEATEVDDCMRELFGDSSRLAPHLHAPLQSGSDRILKRMGRHWYTADDYASNIERIASRHSVFAFGADIICGFPGETNADHKATVELVTRLPFTSLHVFPYSPRPGAAATQLDGQVTSAAIDERANELREIGTQKATLHRSRRAGGKADVVAVSRHEGLTEDYLSVAISDLAIRRRDRFDAILDEREGQLVATPVISLPE
jgi:threonylcarbamoyladenosine tRNA methylthiotransferase MtaB